MNRKMMSVAAIGAMMAADHSAFADKLEQFGGQYARKDAGAPSLAEIANMQTKLAETVEAFRSKNDERLEAIEKRGDADVLTTEELDRIKSDVDKLLELRSDVETLAKRASRPGADAENGVVLSPEQIEHREAFLTLLRNPDDEQAKSTVQELQKKAVTTTTDASGGYAVPEVIAQQIQRELAEISPLRNLVHVVQAGSKDYKELVDRRGLTYGWVGETDTRTATDTPGLAEVVPTFGMIYAYPSASEESLDDMFFNVESWLVDSILEGFAEGEENAIVNGNGTKKPTGFLNGTPVETADGARAFGTLQYMRSGDAADITDPEVFIDLVQTLKKGYRSNAVWLMNKGTVGTAMKLKDGDGNFLWKMGDIKSGQPDRLLGYSIAESEEMPDVAANAFPIAFGDFKAGYVLADLVGFRLTRDEITTPGYVKWYARRRLGGTIRKDEAIKLLRCQASA